MNSTQRAGILLGFALLATGCEEPEKSKTVVITMTSSPDCDNADTGPNACFCASPDPASVSHDETFKFKNDSANTYTIMAGTETAIGTVPLTNLTPGESSSELQYAEPGVYYYYAQTCPPTGLHLNRHTINVLVD